MGKIGVAVSPANPDRVYAIVEAEQGGLYRSRRCGQDVAAAERGPRLIQTRSWYYMNIIADPTERRRRVGAERADPASRSTAAARSRGFRRTHGDNHGLWINPEDRAMLINATTAARRLVRRRAAAGARRTTSRRRSSTTSRSTTSFRTASTAASRTTRSVIIKSRERRRPTSASATGRTARAARARTSASTAKKPRYVYGGCYQGIIEELDTETRPTRAHHGVAGDDRSRSRRTRSGTASTGRRRSSSRSTIPRSIYHGGNVLFRTTDRGKTWAPISPDLTRNDKTTQGWGGAPITNEGAGGEVYGTIFVDRRIAARRRARSRSGTDDGLVQLTRDGGKTWTNVTPAGVPARPRERDRGVAARRRRPRTSRSARIGSATSRRTRSSRPTTARRGRAS